MDKHEKTKGQEWLNNDEERNKRLGELGLSGDQKYSGLSDEERQYLNMDDAERKISVVSDKKTNKKEQYITKEE